MLIGRGRAVATALVLVAAAAAVLLYFLIDDGGSSAGEDGTVLAQLGEAEVTHDEFEDAVRVALAGRFTPGAEVAPAFPGAVDFGRCRLKADDLGSGSPFAALERRCRKDAAAIQDQVRSLLVPQLWYERQAQEDDLEISDEEIDERLQAIERSFEKPADFERLVENAGGEDALRPFVGAQLLQEAVRDAASETSPDEISDKEIAGYYRENRKLYPGQSLKEASDAIRGAILGERQSKASAKLQLELEREWKPQTECVPEFTALACGPGKIDARKRSNERQGKT